MNDTDGLDTLNENGTPPKTRMDGPLEAGFRIQQFMDAEKRGRAGRRAMVKGLVDGNPPYRQADLRNAGRANQCNVNWRVSEFYLNQARSAFYDVFSESPTFATIQTGFGSPSNRDRYSRIITEEFDRMMREDLSWDYVNQISQFEMILYGCGPILFQDDKDWRNVSMLSNQLLVPEFAPSDPNKWEEAVIPRDYLCHELYAFVRNPEKASEVGWNVEATKKAIMEAHPKYTEGGQYSAWEWHQQQLKNKSYWYSAQSKVIQCVHYYYREFPLPGQDEGAITHAILINPEATQQTQQGYLFHHIGRFKSWLDIVHPMYYDNDGGGYHHSVTGLGVKMYSAMEYQNRLLCNLADKTFAPKVLFRPTTANANEQLNIIQFGDYGKVPANFDTVQIPVGSFMEDSMVFHREVTRLVSSNLSQYSPSLSKESGNPITAYEASIRASEQARLGKTQLNHYYAQLDRLMEVKYKRAVNPNLTGFDPGGREARAFIQRCVERGVPEQAVRQYETVKATRIVGQGSQFMRQQSLKNLLGMMPMLNEGGRNNLLNDYIASETGQAMVDRYNPPIQLPSELDDQRALATLQVAASKDGVAPVVTANQNHFIFAQTFLQAASQAAASLEGGGDPFAIYQFIETIGPATLQHLNALKSDPTRAREYKVMERQWAELAQFHDKLGQQLEKQAQAQQENAAKMQKAQAIQSGQDPDTAIKYATMESENRRKNIKLQSDLERKNIQAQQKLVLADASTANKIRTSNVLTASKLNGESSEE